MKKTIPFKKTNILLPKDNFEKWSVIACDQFTSDKEYWADTQKNVGVSYSTLHITLPEIYLEDGDVSERIEKINNNMLEYLNSDVFCEYKDALIYIERIQPDGRTRAGVIGAVDLEEYEYTKDSKKMIRATEGTVLERIPPRVAIRKDAPLELPHIMLLIDDVNKTVIEPLAEKKNNMRKLYDFDLMMGGGHITGYLIDEESSAEIINKLETLCSDDEEPLLFAVGDGNHSLATAKSCYELLKKTDPDASNKPSRYALAEVGNIHSDALDFEPIYRVLFSVSPEDVLNKMNEYFSHENANKEIIYTFGEKEGSIKINIPDNKLTVGVLQEFIDLYLKNNPDAKVDYIHGIDDVKKITQQENTIGFIYDGISKDTLFSSVKATGALPRKTFSMGHARDKRYYLECRKIK
ncbi:MAG: DUF1015 domain-containing protein [Ruminococcaceae bacterium]|nr:DUF1015 domain-containing protein [Oscillospiraceae bacterium]